MICNEKKEKLRILADVEWAMKEQFKLLYREAAATKNRRMIRLWQGSGHISDEEAESLIAKNEGLAETLGKPFSRPLHPMTQEERTERLVDWYFTAQRTLLNDVPLSPSVDKLSATDRAIYMSKRNGYVALYLLLREMFPEYAPKLSDDELMVEDFPLPFHDLDESQEGTLSHVDQ